MGAMSALFAFLHHVAAFTLVATLAIEFVLIRGELDVRGARRLQIADLLFGASAGAILLIGLLRVFYFEKGAGYYFHSWPFIAKLVLFVAVGLLSIVPTLEFLSWSKGLKQGRAPVIDDSKRRRLRAVMHWELAGVMLILLCAALMARGIGTFD
jgi:putative membrane protein